MHSYAIYIQVKIALFAILCATTGRIKISPEESINYEYAKSYTFVTRMNLGLMLSWLHQRICLLSIVIGFAVTPRSFQRQRT